MGAKTWMLAYADRAIEDVLKSGRQINRKATENFVQRPFSKERLEPAWDGALWMTCPPDDEVHVACFDGVSIMAAKEFGLDYPSQLPQPFVAAAGAGSIYLHAMHSVVDWCAFAKWEGGKLVRSVSVSPDSGVLENIGTAFRFEAPFWAGNRPASDDPDDEYPLPFHPLELGEAALLAFFGYQLEGDQTRFDPGGIPLLRFKRKRSRWKFW